MFLVLVFLALTGAASASTIGFVSDTTWQVSQGETGLGPAQTVCLNGSVPNTCPGGATLYGHPGPGWASDLSAISGAAWIWAPEINGSSPATSTGYTFANSFGVDGAPVGGSIWISVDDFAQIRVNGTLIGAVGSIADGGFAGLAQSGLTQFDISDALHSGLNTIEIYAQNGNFCPGGGECAYSLNPGGVVFGGYLLTEVPEPGTMTLIAFGFMLLAAGRYRYAKR